MINNEKLKILVSAHKPCTVYEDNVYTPIHVGRANSRYKSEMSHFIGDDTGDNISSKNNCYCELTAVYWAWKNLSNVKYIGFAHYRRYFETKYTNENIEQALNDCDIILAKPYLHDRYNELKLARTLTMEDEVIFLRVLKDKFPEYEKACIDYLYDFIDYPFNMFVTTFEIFDKYCSFLFSILDGCESLMKPLPYTCSMRRMGYIAEYLLPIFCMHNRLKIKTDPVVSFIGESAPVSSEWKQLLKIKMLKKIYDKHNPKSIDEMFMESVLIGLKNDNIL